MEGTTVLLGLQHFVVDAQTAGRTEMLTVPWNIPADVQDAIVIYKAYT